MSKVKVRTGNKNVMWVTVMVFVIGSLAVYLNAQVDTGKLMGFVFDTDGKTPLEEARVLLKRVASENGEREYKSEATPETGNYTIENIPAGRYTASLILKSGRIYHTLTVVDIAGDQTLVRSFHLAPRRPFLAFLYEPCGIAMLIAGTGVVLKVTEREVVEVSPTEL